MNRNLKIGLDVCVVALAWAALAAVVMEPRLQLAALAVGSGVIAWRALWRRIGRRGRSDRTG